MPKGILESATSFIPAGIFIFMQLTIFSDESDLSFFVLSDGTISISHEIHMGPSNEFIITEKEFLVIVKFIQDRIIDNKNNQ